MRTPYGQTELPLDGLVIWTFHVKRCIMARSATDIARLDRYLLGRYAQ